jgi:hypothetical protein
MRQSSLSNFVKVLPIRNFFCLDFDHTSRLLASSEWTLLGTANVILPLGGGRVEIHLCRRQRDADLDFCPEPTSILLPVPLLISNLQKAIRRMCADTATATAKQLLFIDPVALCRRLPIIAIEDARSDKDLSTCVWLMMSLAIGHRLSNADGAWLVAYAGALAAQPARVPFPRSCVVRSGRDVWNRAHSSCDDIAMALLLRAAYGGMHGDVQMLAASATMPHCDAMHIVSTIPALHWTDIRQSDILEASIDFHCMPYILTALSAETGLSEAQIKTAIWEHSSRINARVDCHDGDGSLAHFEMIYEKLGRFRVRALKRVFQRL